MIVRKEGDRIKIPLSEVVLPWKFDAVHFFQKIFRRLRNGLKLNTQICKS
jgi:hypothetical protein